LRGHLHARQEAVDRFLESGIQHGSAPRHPGNRRKRASPAVVLWQIGKPNAPGVYPFILSNTWDWRSLASAPPSVAGRSLLLGTAPARRTLRLVSSHTVPRWRRERLGVSPQAAPAPAWSSPANGSTRPIPHAASLPRRAIPGQQSPARWPRSAS